MAWAFAETINGPYETEIIYPSPCKSIEEVEFATLEWVDSWRPRRTPRTTLPWCRPPSRRRRGEAPPRAMLCLTSPS
jgi:hypothetical protein